MFLGIRDPGWEKILIRDKHPGSATLIADIVFPRVGGGRGLPRNAPLITEYEVPQLLHLYTLMQRLNV
jgi:hypothetical protein